jgi:hypothetical protein
MRRWVRSKQMGIGHYVVCPFCVDRREKPEQALNALMPWCAT